MYTEQWYEEVTISVLRIAFLLFFLLRRRLLDLIQRVRTVLNTERDDQQKLYRQRPLLRGIELYGRNIFRLLHSNGLLLSCHLKGIPQASDRYAF